jgi:hypothetical protein
MRPHYAGRYVFTSLGDLLQKEELRAALARRRVSTPLGDLRKFGANGWQRWRREEREKGDEGDQL